MSFCPVCFKSKASCLCEYIKPFDSQIKFVLLMHPKEARQMRTGTGRLTKLTLLNSEVIIGEEFSNNERLKELLADNQYFPLLLYPGVDAYTAKELKPLVTDKKLLIIVIDGTWFLANKMIRLSPNLKELNKISFTSGYRSQFKFKHQPQEECLSTIESCYYLIKELQESEVISSSFSPEPLMEVFNRMVDFQLECEQLRHTLIGYKRDTVRISLEELKQKL